MLTPDEMLSINGYALNKVNDEEGLDQSKRRTT